MTGRELHDSKAHADTLADTAARFVASTVVVESADELGGRIGDGTVIAFTLPGRDPTAIAWIIVLAYVANFGCCVLAWRRSRENVRVVETARGRRTRNGRLITRFWLATFVILGVLGVNKQLDFQTDLLHSLRRTAVDGGWYQDRRKWQVDFILVGLIAATVIAIFLVWLLRRVIRRIFVSFFGLLMLGGFVIIRAISYHYVDKVLALGGRLGVNAFLELGGNAVVAVGAIYWLLTEPRFADAAAESPDDPREPAIRAHVASDT